MEKVTRMAMLYDFYGQLLTDRQRHLFELYYDHDLSLGEIAEELEITRQAVHDLLKRSEKILEEYETKLGLVNKFLTESQHLFRLVEDLKKFRSTQDPAILEQMEETLIRLLDANK
ncbi:MAG: putative DNA-binding protein [Clostridia bacterium]|nr:putative DNA-binding protein [Clostridia bacterium]